MITNQFFFELYDEYRILIEDFRESGGRSWIDMSGNTVFTKSGFGIQICASVMVMAYEYCQQNHSHANKSSSLFKEFIISYCEKQNNINVSNFLRINP